MKVGLLLVLVTVAEHRSYGLRAFGGHCTVTTYILLTNWDLEVLSEFIWGSSKWAGFAVAAAALPSASRLPGAQWELRGILHQCP